MRYPKDPHWLAARFPGQCRKCGAAIRKGDRIYYHPLTRTVLCAACGEPAAAETAAAVADEIYYTGADFDHYRRGM